MQELDEMHEGILIYLHNHDSSPEKIVKITKNGEQSYTLNDRRYTLAEILKEFFAENESHRITITEIIEYLLELYREKYVTFGFAGSAYSKVDHLPQGIRNNPDWWKQYSIDLTEKGAIKTKMIKMKKLRTESYNLTKNIKPIENLILKFRELEINLNNWILRNTKNEKQISIHGTQLQFFLLILILHGGKIIDIKALKKEIRYMEDKEKLEEKAGPETKKNISCDPYDLKSLLAGDGENGKLKKIGISKKTRKELIIGRHGYALCSEFFLENNTVKTSGEI